MIDDYSKSHQILTLYSIFKRKIDDYVDFKQNASTHTILVDGTVKNFLESTLEFLQETDQVHQSFQLSELSNMLARVIGSIKKEDEMFEFCDEICKTLFKILLDIQQNLSSALELWKFIARLLQNDQLNFENRFLYFIEDNLRKRIHSLSRLSNYQEKEFNNEILILKNLLNSVPRESISLVSTLSRVVLHEENFTMLSKNCLILKVFQQTFLAGGLGFNIDDLALERDENTGEFKYIWLLCELLTSSYLPSLAGYTHLRNQIQTFCESEVLPLILRECCTEFSESNNTLFFSMILYLTKRSIEKSSLYAKTLGNIIRMIIDPPEGLYELVADFNRWKDLLDVTINTHIDSVLTTEDSNDSQARRKIEMVKIVSNSAKSLLSSLESYQDIRKKIINSLDVDKQSNIILYCAMADDTRWQTAELQFMDQDPEDKTDTYNEVKSLQAILKHVSSQLDQKYSDFATLDSILESLNCAVTKMGIANMFDNFDIDHNKISIFLKNAIDFLIVEESSFENEETEESKEDKTQKTAITLNTLGINLLQFIKMIIGHLHSKNQESTVTIIDGVLEYSKTKAEAFNIKMDLLKDRIKATQTSKSKKKQVQSENKEEQLSEYSRQIQEQEYEVIDCISGVVSNITPYVHTQIDEDVLYTLVGTHIETVQKAAYVTLVHFYQNFIPALKYQYEEEGEINEEEFKEQIEKEIAEGEETKEEEEVKEDTQKVTQRITLYRLKYSNRRGSRVTQIRMSPSCSSILLRRLHSSKKKIISMITNKLKRVRMKYLMKDI